MKYICLHLLTVFYLTQQSNKQIICFYLEKQNNALQIVICVPWNEYRKSSPVQVKRLNVLTFSQDHQTF
jgi:hypothetical protein